MTVCNMSIEGGARAGHDRARRHDLRLPRGPARRADRAPTWERGARALARARHRTTTPSTTASVEIDVAALAPQVTWGTNPGMVVPVDGAVPDPADCDDPDDRAAVERALDYMGLEPGHADRGHRDRPRLHRLLHERAHRGPARRGRGRRRPARRPDACARWSCRARRRSSAQAEEEGLDRIFEDAGFEWRRAGCSMCLGMNPDILAPGRALRLDLEPQLRGPPGRGGRTHLVSPAMAAAAAIAGRFVDVRELAVGSEARSARVTVARRRARPRRRRHRPDHPEAVPEADRAHRLRRVPLLRLAQGSRLRAEPARVRRARGSWSPAATSAAARRASTRRGRCRTTASRSSIAPSFGDIFRQNCAQDRPAPGRAAARAGEGADACADGGELTSTSRRHDPRAGFPFEFDPFAAPLPAGGPRRDRPDARARGRDRGLRVGDDPAGLDADARLAALAQSAAPRVFSRVKRRMIVEDIAAAPAPTRRSRLSRAGGLSTAYARLRSASLVSAATRSAWSRLQTYEVSSEGYK